MEEEQVVARQPRTKWQIISDISMRVLAVTTFAYIVMVTLYPYNRELTVHAILGTFGLVILMSESITVYTVNSWYNTISSTAKTIIHSSLQGLGSVFILVATCLQVYHTTRSTDYVHFRSVHSITALLSTCMIVTSCWFGIALLKPSWFPQKLQEIGPTKLKILHSGFGIITFLVAMISLIAALYSDWFETMIPIEMRILMTIYIIWLVSYTTKGAVLNLIMNIFTARTES